MRNHATLRTVHELPRLPLEGSLDLTYRCNNTCLHCWLWKPPHAAEQQDELTFDEIRRIADQARALGTQRWQISGGEPMLRPDFPEIFDYLTCRARSYSLNTNGTLITPQIAQLLRLKGSKMIALYGATAEVYDAVTGNPGGFEALMRGLAYLREAGAGFTVQLIPMRSNWHQWGEMQALARSLSPHYRVGAPWLNLSADGSQQKNRQIAGQRLPSDVVIELDRPDLSYDERLEDPATWPPSLERTRACGISPPADREERAGRSDDRLFAGCTDGHSFHIDPYGRMTFCCFIKDPALRYNLRRGTFRTAWEEFIPSVAERVRGGREWSENCGSCDKRDDCRTCPAYAYLETGRYSAPVPYLCALAGEAKRFKAEWPGRHRRYFRIAGITVRLESDLEFAGIKFPEALESFAVAGPGDDNVTLHHHFELPDLKENDLGKELYRKVPWVISRRNGTWSYRSIGRGQDESQSNRVAVFSADHTHASIYNAPCEALQIRTYGWQSLSRFSTDQIWLVPLLADRHAVLLHSGAAILNGRGLLFVGHSDAGKSTMVLDAERPRRNPLRRPQHLAQMVLFPARNGRRSGWRMARAWHMEPRRCGGCFGGLCAFARDPVLAAGYLQRNRASYRPQGDLESPARYSHQGDGDRGVVAKGAGRAGANRGGNTMLYYAL